MTNYKLVMKIFTFKGGLIAMFMLALCIGAKAQTTTTTTTTTVTTTTTTNSSPGPAQNIFVELGGPGLTFSANYDTRFGNRRDGIGGRVGFGFVAESGNSIFSIPVQLNYLLGKNGRYFEVGGGATYAATKGNHDEFFSFDDADTLLGSLTFGYRSQPIDGGFNFRASFNPLFDSKNFIPYFGISFGYTFK